MNFFIVYYNYHGRYNKKLAGTVQSIGKGQDDYTTLQGLNMRIGDIVDVSINKTSSKPT